MNLSRDRMTSERVRDIAAGALIGAGAAFAWHRWSHSRSQAAAHQSRAGVEGAQAAEDFDTAGADLRVLRKAEAVIQRRTDQIIVVVERCTATHNYTAVIRTAEALGIQHVWLIAPPSKDVILGRQGPL